MSVTNAVNTAIYGTITATSAVTNLLAGTTSVYYMQAPDGATLPYVVWSYSADTPDNEQGSDMRQEVIWLRGYASTPALSGSIDAQLSTLFHRNQFTVSGYTNFWTARENGVYTVENEPNGDKIYGHGAFYRVRLDPT